jgi:cellulose synthase/poly-beta-1,6-N-acetylglucosamine synthase-like glycosyltransferase
MTLARPELAETVSDVFCRSGADLALETPKVTVLIVVYNGEKYLAEAIESILGQTFGDFELIIINDGSKDATAGILAHYEQVDDGARVCHQEGLRSQVTGLVVSPEEIRLPRWMQLEVRKVRDQLTVS